MWREPVSQSPICLLQRAPFYNAFHRTWDHSTVSVKSPLQVQRRVKNPLYGRKIPKEVKEQLPAEIRELLSRKALRIPGPTAEILPIQKQLKVLLKRVWPDGSDEDLSGLSVTLAGVWEVSRKHIFSFESFSE